MKVTLANVDLKDWLRSTKDYTGEFSQVTELLERKKDLRIRVTQMTIKLAQVFQVGGIK
jgi:hypothetical protein